MGTSTNSPHIVIVGGGTAGLTIAARLLKTLPTPRVTILDPSDKHYYQPLWTLVGAGEFNKSVSERDQKSVIPPGAEWIQESVAEFRPTQNQIVTTQKNIIGYDALVVVPGMQSDWDLIPGLRESLGKNGVCSNYSFTHVNKTWDFIRNFSGGTAVFTQPQTPIKCGGAPQKIMYMADDWFRKKNVRDKTKVIFASGAASIFAVPKYAAALTKVIERKKIETRFKTNLIEVRGYQREAVFQNVDTKETSVIRYDLLHVTPPMSAPDFIKQSSLANAGGWVDIHQHTLQHTRYPNIFSAGDASSAPTSRTGAAIRKQAPVLVENLLALLSGQPLKASYDGYTSCPLTTGYGKLILAEFDYKMQPQETFPFDQSKERLSMYLFKKHLLPKIYWKGMLKGRC